MPNSNLALAFSITDTIKDIPQEDWDRLFSEDIIEGYGYQKTLEEANLKEFSFGYLLGRRGSDLVLIMPFFIMDFSFDTLTKGCIHKLLLKFKRILSLKVIFMGAVTKEELYLGMAKNEDFPNLMDGALAKIYEFSKHHRISGLVFWDVGTENRPLLEFLDKLGFLKMRTLPNTKIEIKARTFEDYLGTLSKNMRKDLKRKLSRSLRQAQLNTQIRQDIDQIIQDIYRLYLNNFSDADVHFEVLTPEFFKHICANLPGVARFFVTYAQDKIVAFNLCLIKNDTFIDKFIGFDPEVAHKYHLYFTTFCHNMDWCIKNGIRFYITGITDYHPKVRLGARLIPLYICAKAINPILNIILRLISPFIEPIKLDSTLKDIENLQTLNPKP